MNLFFVRMCKCAALLCWLVIENSTECRAQQTAITCREPVKVDANTWKYNSVSCTSGNGITSVIVSLFNGEIASNTSDIRPSSIHTSLGSNPQVYTYFFAPAITADQTADFIRGMTFSVNNTGAKTSASVTVDANPSHLPPGATITTFDHPDGTTHYYVFVDKERFVRWDDAYREAKSYYLMGMRGYLATITGKEEDDVLVNISGWAAWSGGTRIDVQTDAKTIDIGESKKDGSNRLGHFMWNCGPETGVIYFTGKTSQNGQAVGYSSWQEGEPNASLWSGKDLSEPECCMQINYDGRLWNDLSPVDQENAIARGFFIEFGGTENTGSGPMAIKYKRPAQPVDNDQWYFYDPANQASSSEVSLTFAPHIYILNVK